MRLTERSRCYRVAGGPYFSERVCPGIRVFELLYIWEGQDLGFVS